MAKRLRLLLCAAGAALVAAAGLAHSAPSTSTGAAISTPPPYPLVAWSANSDNVVAVQGTVTLRGAPVSGARLRVDAYELPALTDARGHFVYLADDTRLARHVVSVVDTSTAKDGATLLNKADRSALAARSAAITVAYPIRALRVSRDGAGRPVVSGRLVYTPGAAPPPVALYSYALTGTVTDASGKPVADARVSTRTLDRDYWTVSSETDAHGRYSSLFTASDESGHSPVPLTVRISKGDLVYEFLPEEYIPFARLQSAHLDLRLPPRDYPLLLPLPRSYPGAIYEGLAVGVAQGNTPLRPAKVTWPDRNGRFQITLPRSLRGRTVSLWEAKLDVFSRAQAKPGGQIDLREWPKALQPDTPRDLAHVVLK